MDFAVMADPSTPKLCAPSEAVGRLLCDRQGRLQVGPQGAGQQTAQREIISALGTALDARRQRIIVSQAEVNPVKWCCLYLQAICELLAIAVGLFATGVAASVLLIAVHDRPFTGEISVGPGPLLQIMPSEPPGR
jgi:hypothetical protein